MAGSAGTPGRLHRWAWVAIPIAVCLGGQAPVDPSPTQVRRALAELEEGDWIQRWGAMQLLAEAGAAEAIQPLRRLQADERQDAWLRERALVTLAHIEPAAAMPIALRLAGEREDPAAQAAAVEALGVMRLPRAREALLAALQADSPVVQRVAVEAYARLAPQEAMPFIEAALRSKDPDAVRHGVRGLSYVETPEARDTLWSLIAGEDEAAALEAVAIAARLQSPEAVPALLEAAADAKRERLATGAVRALATYPEHVLADPLASALQDGDDVQRKAALRVLRERPVPVALDAAATLAADGTLDPALLIDAMELMVQVDPSRHRAALAAQIDHESSAVRRLAARGLARATDDPFPPLRPLLADPDGGVRTEAVHALRRSEAPTPEGGIIAYLEPALQRATPNEAPGLLALAADRVAVSERDAALRVLSPFLADSKTRPVAVAVLTRVADDPLRQQVAAATGYLWRWRVVGPFGEVETAADRLGAPSPPEQDPAAASYTVDGHEFTWLMVDGVDIDGQLNPGLLPALRDPERPGGILVARAAVESEGATTVRIHVRSRAGVALSVNGSVVAMQPTPGTLENEVELRPGRNDVQLKLAGRSDQWQFSVRLADDAGGVVPGIKVIEP